MQSLSILTSAYNAEKYIKAFIKNLSQQTFQDFELCLEHICPTVQETKKIKKSKLDENKLSYVEQNKKISLPAAWNNMIDRSKGKYLCIWNIDDLRTTNSLGLMVKELEDDKNIGFVYGNYFIVDKYKKKKGAYINEEGREEELKTGMILGPFFMFRRSVLESIGKFDEQLISGADYDFAMRLARKFNGKHLNSNLGYYLNTGDGLSTKENSRQEIERTAVELRYGIKVLNENLVDEATITYDLENIITDGKKLNIKSYSFKE
tara:strand:+ start:251 stop:1039 length:789 start_codon:yes stop_codon:yes gene_type:complete